jgi:hypothetical protein
MMSRADARTVSRTIVQVDHRAAAKMTYIADGLEHSCELGLLESTRT